MGLKESNEITVKIKCELDELNKLLQEKGFQIVDKYSIDDTFFVPRDLNLSQMNTRDILVKQY